MLELSGLTLVVTRPVHQAEILCQSITESGGDVVRFPVIEIVSSSNSKRFRNLLARLNEFDIAIFISANAVNQTFDDDNIKVNWPAIIKIAAVGKATAKALRLHKLEVNLVAPEPFNSEALLTLAEFQDVSGKNIVIFRGEGGREHLAETLKQRGAKVEYAECYQRVIAKRDPTMIFAAWSAERQMAFIVTSNEGLENLVKLLAEKKELLLNSDLDNGNIVKAI